MARSEEGKRRDDNDERKSNTKRRHRKSPADSDSLSDDNRKRKENRRERKENKQKRIKKDKKKRRQREGDDEDEEYASDEQQVRVKERSNGHKHKWKKRDDHHGPKQGMKEAVEEVKALSEEDYFLKNNEFSTWLKRERGMFFSNLSSEGAHMLFLEFVSAWNSGELHSDYYEGMSSAPRTDHNWGLKGIKKTLSEGVMDPIEEREIAKKFEKSKREKFQKIQEVVLDELLPLATGREKMLEKRSLNREKARAREDSPELIKEKELLGGSDDFHVRLDKEKKRRQKKEMEKSAVFAEKLQASRQKEAEAMNQLQAILNDAGGKITIPKRN